VSLFRLIPIGRVKQVQLNAPASREHSGWLFFGKTPFVGSAQVSPAVGV
jgi:hypothetical protein